MSFTRTELRVLQIKHPDNTEFLTIVANMIDKITQERDSLKEEKNRLICSMEKEYSTNDH